MPPRLRSLLPLLGRLALALAFFAPLPLGPSTPNAHAQEIPDGHAHLVIITDFDQAEIEINGVSYPWEWIWGGSEGVFLPADRPYSITVSTSPETSRTFRFRLRPGEQRILVVDVANMGQSAPPPSRAERPAIAPPTAEGEEEGENIGYLGVSSSPRGTVIVDGSDSGVRTPARRIELEPGRHEVQIRWDDSEDLSEVKYVLIRTGVNTNVFFRQPRTSAAED